MQVSQIRLCYQPRNVLEMQLDTTIIILDIIHRPVFYLKHDVSETGFCLRLQGEPAQFGPINRASLCLLTLAGSI
jgi:hypothetical protein